MMRSLCSRHCYQIAKHLILIPFTILFYDIEVKSIEKCELNFVFDELNQRCMECPAGSFGPGCDSACPPLTYGRFCVHTCNCSTEQCHKIRGCSGATNTYEEGTRNISIKSTHKKTQPGGFQLTVLISVAGTFVSSVLVLAIVYQLRSKMMLCQKKGIVSSQMSCENENIYSEAESVNNYRSR